jgi:hypothetical protein
MGCNHTQREKRAPGSLLWYIIVFLSLGAAKAGDVSFARDVLPILSDNCFHCHGPDPTQRKAGLRLHDRESVLGVTEDKAMIVPGKPHSSVLVERIRSLDAEEIMPPPETNKILGEAEKKLLERWISEGAKWGEHWAFLPPKRSSVPLDAGHPIDYFIQQRLHKEDWHLSEPAPRHTLLRRLSFDLTGLPPSPRDVTDFAADTSPDALSHQVHRLLNSPHFGERMAMWWLDAARYADTDGYQGDAIRSHWPWRDWVVNAFNANMPFDQFTMEQFAGDLLPEATPEQVLATGFHRNHMTNGEGGRHPEESRIDYVIDRVNTIGTLWMGITAGCAQCHSHKFDPISQKEYYQLNAFFNNVNEDGRAGPGAKPLLPYQSADSGVHLRAAKRQLKHAHERLEKVAREVEPLFEQWLEARKAEVMEDFQPWYVLHPSHLETVEGSKLSLNSGGVIHSHGLNPRQEDYHLTAKPDLKRITGLRLEVFSHEAHSSGRYGRGRSGEFILTNIKLFVRQTGALLMREVPIAQAHADFEAKPEGGARYGKVMDTLDDDPRNGWTTRGDTLRPVRLAVFALKEPLAIADDEEMIFVMMHRSTVGDANTGRFRLLVSNQPGAAVRSLDSMPMEELKSALVEGQGTLSDKLVERLKQQFLEDHRPYQSEKAYLDRVQVHFKEAEKGAGAQNVMVLGERKETRETHVLLRGVWDQKGELVQPALPAALGYTEPSDEPRTRMDLAGWLVSGKHPLTARVAVNHLWQLLFGAGLVRTPDDFGLQGAPPTHPELLDWLAVTLVQSGWDLKHMIRLLVTSRTYQQSSHVTGMLMDRDPYNRLWARASRHRLPSWMLHDAALQVSGLLNPLKGGVPVKPFQPSGVWKDIFMGRLTYEPSPGASRYRRMLYAFWRRSSAPAFLFDQAQRRVCEVRTRRTNTPLHALTMLNDETILEASQALAAQCLQSAVSAEEALKEVGFRILSRSFEGREYDVLLGKWHESRAYYREHPEEALYLLNPGQQRSNTSIDAVEHASLMWMANLIFNLDEAMTHE